MNRYPLWKYIFIVISCVIALTYALPNMYGKVPAVQISANRGAEVSDLTKFQVEAALESAKVKPVSYELGEDKLTVKFHDTEVQLKAQAAIQKELGASYVVALNLASATPTWLQDLGGEPMFLGLDLRGGVHFLMEIDMDTAVKNARERYVSDLRTNMRKEKVRYKAVTIEEDGAILVRYRNAEQEVAGEKLLRSTFPLLEREVVEGAEEPQIKLRMSEQEIIETKRFAVQQNITTLRKRVNELGVAEPLIQQQGLNRVVVQLPGVQDTARAKEILGATATLEFRMVDQKNDAGAAENGRVPAGSKLYKDRNGFPVLLKKNVMLTGEYIIDAASSIDTVDGSGPQVNITLDGKGANIFAQSTRDQVGNQMAVVFIEQKTTTVEENGELVKKRVVNEEVINRATIQEQLGKRFRITGLDSSKEARNLALLLRAGALAAPIEIVEERTVGPSLGQDNIEQGFNSVIVGFALVLLFMAIYYKVFGLVADVALALNLVFIIAMLSMLQATLTLPGIAGIVLTVGMAVDANVLIFERIREEIKNGNSPQASIQAGYEKAFSTIADANITTLIAAIVLFSFGTGPIKGFAVTLSLGIISSMFTAIFVSRGLVNLIYGGRRVSKLAI